MPIHLYSYKLPLKSLPWKEREGLILEWNGGWGEIAPLPGFSRESFEEAKAEILSLLPYLATAKSKLPSVQFGIACAAKPFPMTPIKIPLSALGPRAGFSTAKLKLGSLSLSDAIRLTKEYVSHYKLRIDCNRAWTLEQALEFASHFSPASFEYLEEPLQSFSDLVRFSEKTRFPIAADESLRDGSPWRLIPTLKAAVVKPTLMGAIPPLPPHLQLILSSSIESGLGLLHIARLATSSLPIGLDTAQFFTDNLLTAQVQTENGLFSWQTNSQPLIDLSKLCLVH